MSAFESIIAEVTDARLTITLNRPEKRNALTHAMMVEIGAAIALAEENPSIRMVILRGADGHFCAGGDIEAMQDLPAPTEKGAQDPLFAPYRLFGDVLLRLNRLPQAVLAIVEGSAVGGGFGMACCADIVLAHEKAQFGLPEPRAGFIPSQIIPFVVRRIGEAATRHLAVTSALIDGDEAYRLGIAQYIFDNRHGLSRRLDQTAMAVQRGAPEAIAAVKALILRCANEPDAVILDAAAEKLVELLRSDIADEGMRAFLSKQRPPWANDKV